MRDRIVGMMLVALVAGMPVLAQDETPEPSWVGNLGLSFVATSGNTDTQTLGVDFGMVRKADPWGIEFLAKATRAEKDSELTAERYEAAVVGRRALNERWEVYSGLAGEKDQFKGYDLRTVLDAGFTYRALLGPEHQVWFDAGMAYTDENRIEPEPDDDYFGAKLAGHWEWAIGDNATFRQDLTYFPNFDESENWRGASNSSVQASLNSWLAMKVGYEIRYENLPGYVDDVKRDKTDTTTNISLVVKF